MNPTRNTMNNMNPTPTPANTRQVGGDHYASKDIQPWDYITSNNLPFLEGNIVKYITRWRDKGGVQDLHKARHYLDKLLEIEQAKAPAPPKTTRTLGASVPRETP